MKTQLFLLFCILPFIGQACSCAWVSNFCETSNLQSVISTVKVIDKFDDGMRHHFLKVEIIEDLRGITTKDTMTILASSGTSCDVSPEGFNINDILIVLVRNNPDVTDTGYSYDFPIEGGCSRSYIFLIDGMVKQHPADDTGVPYEDFKSEIEECVKASVLDEPEVLNRLTYIFPNPALNKLKIRIYPAGNFSYTIYSTAGQKMREAEVIGFQEDLDISNFENGVYYLKIRVNRTAIFKKIVKI